MYTNTYNFYLGCITIFKSIKYIRAISIRRFSVCSPSFGSSLSQHLHLRQSAPGSSVISSQPSFCLTLFKNQDSLCILLNLWNQFYMHQNNLNMFWFCHMHYAIQKWSRFGKLNGENQRGIKKELANFWTTSVNFRPWCGWEGEATENQTIFAKCHTWMIKWLT